MEKKYFKNKKKLQLAPSILSCNFGRLEENINMINESEADILHLDIMDGVFVPTISMGQPIVKHIAQLCKKPIDIHFMIIEPQKHIPSFIPFGIDYISVHIEGLKNREQVIKQIKNYNCFAGIAIKPNTPIKDIEPILCEIDYVCVMSVEPGFAGQKFIPATYEKIKELKRIIEKNNYSIQIEVDGGVTLDNAPKILEAGADILVSAKSIFQSPNPLNEIKKFKA